MTLLNYIQNMSQTHLAGHLSPKSRPATPLPSEPVTPAVESQPPVLVYEPSPAEPVDLPTEPIPVADAPAESAPAPEPAPAPVETVEPVAAVPDEQPAAEQVVLAAPAVEEVKEVSAPATEPITEIAPLTEEVSYLSHHLVLC